MKNFLIPFFCLFIFSVHAQRVTREVITAEDLKKIVLSTDEVFKIILRTSPGEELKITTRTEGEYFNEIRLNKEMRAGDLFLSSDFREVLQNGYDKLSAHKVFSMEVELEVPVGMIIEVNSNLASVYLSGEYEQVLVQLKSGSCYLENFSGDAIINTFDGNITGTARSINAEASTRHGEVDVPGTLHGNHKMILTSINGDIKLSETK